MMRSIAALILVFVSCVNAFAPSGQRRVAFVPKMSSKMDNFFADSGLTVDAIPMYIDNLDVDNFEASLEMLEPLLTNECVGDECDVFVGELKEKAASIGKDIPEGYAPYHH
mmetsp:Transcript_40267/g.83861  ORF Transcript_40267/g.83861 Transcript_40267/m.83861 type:complete len:111 (-) Transcript_40267:241-573(-)